MILMASRLDLKFLSIEDAQCDVTNNSRFKFERELGRGGFGVVYKATDRDGTDVAIKVILISKEGSRLSLKEVQQEAKTLMRLRNPYIIDFIDCYTFTSPYNQGFSIVTQYCPGGNLGDYLLRDRPNRAKRLQWCRQLSLGIQFIHGKGIAHRDLKPDNILIDGRAALKIADVGLAKAVWKSGLLAAEQQFDQYMATFAGTRSFIAPEVFSHHYSFECDIFSLGLVFLCIIEAPHSSVARIRAHWGWRTLDLGELYYEIPDSRDKDACSLTKPAHATNCPGEINLINEMCYHDYHRRCSIGHVVTTLEYLCRS